ncbi:hypothetical protein ACIBH1_44520 [Nonomuraea sp. NPDC050663]|uniref:hypothetical protein n=1 Tax=Nonomuraea sp. NPDC050663 TaxID=3364370 RepID=UPI0037BDCE8A
MRKSRAVHAAGAAQDDGIADSQRLATLNRGVSKGLGHCQQPGANPDDWFPVTTNEADLQIAAAFLCGGCPLLENGMCWERSLLQPADFYGIIAATTPADRRRLLRESGVAA